ncbi:MAG: hypothetical protein QXT64_02835 [Desulfurococcaceae archaeon]
MSEVKGSLDYGRLGKALREEAGTEVYNPYAYGKNRYKGQLHCHTTNSDGDSPPSAVVAKYRDELGFSFVVFADHNYLTDGSPYTVEGSFLAFKGVEDGGQFNDHMNGIGDLTNYPSGDTVYGYETWNRSRGIALFRGIPQFNHPNWGNINIMEMLNCQPPKLIEIYNYKAGGRLAEGLSMWDLMLRGGSLCWGVSADDVHVLATESGKGWIVVYADELTKPAILDAIMRGAFYSTTGPEMSFSVSGRRITASCPTAVKMRAITSLGLVKTVKASSIDYTLKHGDGFVRFEAVDAAGRWAWSNPFIDMKVFPKLRKTQREIEFMIKSGSTDGEAAIGASTTSTTYTRLYYGTGPKFGADIYHRLIINGVVNPEYLRYRTYWIGYRIVNDELALPATNMLVLEGEIARVHANKYFEVFFRTTDATRGVTVNLSVWFKRLHLPYLLAYNVLT